MIRQPLLLTSGISDLLGIPEQQFFRRSEESTAAGILADKALAMIGAPETFSRNGHGLPVWPAGFNGSISHCQGEAAVAVRQGQPLGIDMEKISRVTDKIFDRIAVPAEKAAAAVYADTALFRATLFCCKEACWKLLQHFECGSPGWREITVRHLGQNRLAAYSCNIDMHGVYLLHKDMLIVIMEKKNEGTFPDPSWIAQ